MISLKVKVLSTFLLMFYLSHEFSECLSNRLVIHGLQDLNSNYKNPIQDIHTNDVIQNCLIRVLNNKFDFVLTKLFETKVSEIVFIYNINENINFESFVKFLKQFVNYFDNKFNENRISIISFQARDQLSFPMSDKMFDKQLSDMPSIQVYDHENNFLDALKTAKELFKYSTQSTQKVIFIVSAEFPNEDNPRHLVKGLIDSNVEIYAFGLQSYDQNNGFYDMVSEPKSDHYFLVNGLNDIQVFFENYTKKSKTNSCDLFCNEFSDCCDVNANCVCDIKTGIQSCVCKSGYYGSGIIGDCNLITCPETQHQVFNKILNGTECQCKKGYTKVANKCEVVKCPKLIAPENGFFSSECNDVYNAACGIICRPGYQLRGTSIRICNENGKWEGIDTKCLVRKCFELKAPKNGEINCTTNDFKFETVCHFGCDSGFQLQGSTKRTCLAIAKWDGLPVTCKPINTH